jgi:predicted RNase H-like HicB family nuclease
MDDAARRAKLEALLRAAGSKPVEDIHELAVEGFFESDDEVDEFLAAVRQWRGHNDSAHQAYSTLRLTAVVVPEAGGYVACALDVELASQGETIEAALANLREAAKLYFEDMPVPQFPAPIIATLDIHVPRPGLRVTRPAGER